MSNWRSSLLAHCGPGLLGGVTLGRWIRLLHENRFRISPAYWPRAATIGVASLLNSALSACERIGFRSEVKDVHVEPPLFVLGHWRSGTTRLFNLLAATGSFGFPNTYQVFFPNTFLVSERGLSRLGQFFVPRQRVMDKMALNFGVPHEDEFAGCVTSLHSPYLSHVFPQNEQHYERYLTMRGVPNQEIDRWKQALVQFMQKLSWKHRRPLVLKSPPHTCRIRLLLEMFPKARFVNIHRHPYDVFRSTMHQRLASAPFTQVQKSSWESIQQSVLRRYQSMQEAYFEERELIPAGQFHEVGFWELEKQPLEVVRGIHERLSLSGWEDAKPGVEQHLSVTSAYVKNEYPELSPDLKRRLQNDWQIGFEAWDYAA